MSIRKGDDVIAGGAVVRIDNQLSTTSVNPVQNKTITTAINTIDTTLSAKQDVISDLATIRSGATAGATAVQPGDLATVATTGQFSDLSGKPTTLAGYSITDGANTDLSNLTANGKETVVGWGMPDYSARVSIAVGVKTQATVDSIYLGSSGGSSGADSLISVQLYDESDNLVIKQANRYLYSGNASDASISIFVPKGYSINIDYGRNVLYSFLCPLKGVN